MKIKIMMLMLAMAGTTMMGCKKEGPPGPAGANGMNGTNGNANVQSTTVTVSAWALSGPSYYTDILYPAITTDIIDQGAVLVYISNGGGGYSQLPLTIYPSTSYSKTYEVVSAPGLARIYCTDSDLTTPVNPGTKTFKIVVIASSGLAQHPGLNLRNYNEVEKAFGLK